MHKVSFPSLLSCLVSVLLPLPWLLFYLQVLISLSKHFSNFLPLSLPNFITSFSRLCLAQQFHTPHSYYRYTGKIEDKAWEAQERQKHFYFHAWHPPDIGKLECVARTFGSALELRRANAVTVSMQMQFRSKSWKVGEPEPGRCLLSSIQKSLLIWKTRWHPKTPAQQIFYGLAQLSLA